MLRANRLTWFVSGVLGLLMLAGCATDPLVTGSVAKHYRRAKPENSVARKEEAPQIDTGSISKDAGSNAAGAVTSKDDPRWQWCEQRHIDHQAGKAPGGATDLAKKLEDDRICAAVYERG
jgi:hypothetical protein